MNENILELEGYGVAFGDKVILSKVDLTVPDRGNVVLMGPAGTGKSTLIRSLCGINYANPSFRTWGKALYVGSEISEDNLGPVLVSQNARLMMSTVLENVVFDLPERNNLTKIQQIDVAKRLLERAGLAQLKGELDTSVIDLPLGMQRHIAIVRTIAANPRLLFIDEPTTGIDEDYVDTLLGYINDEAQRRAVITILHHQGHAKKLPGKVVLLAGGWIHESKSTEEFFSAPESKAGKQLVQSGSCNAIGPVIDEESLEYIDKDSFEMPPPLPTEAKSYVSDALGPRNFLWLKKGILAGTPQPGLLRDMDYDLKALQRVGVTVLITLLENEIDKSQMEEFGITNYWLPINDMEAPTIDEAMEWCERVANMMINHEVVAYHCKAGMGRTGTMLVAQLIWEGMSAFDALETARRTEPRWVQSDVQVEFLEEFEQAVKAKRQTDKVTVNG